MPRSCLVFSTQWLRNWQPEATWRLNAPVAASTTSPPTSTASCMRATASLWSRNSANSVRLP
jgi:hypothetical protein